MFWYNCLYCAISWDYARLIYLLLNSLNKPKEIFNKTKVEEKQELIQIQADVDKNHKVINSSGTPRTADCIADGTDIVLGELI